MVNYESELNPRAKGSRQILKLSSVGYLDEHIHLVADDYNEGDYHDDVAYGQRLLNG